MTSITDFRQNLQEINLLISYAQRNVRDIMRYQMFNKIAVILLATKFEVFLENFFDEHSRLVVMNHTNKSISRDMKEQYIERALCMTEQTKKTHDKERYLQLLLCLWQINEMNITPLMGVRPTTKFNYGKHGKREIENLFKKHGMLSFIERVDVQSTLQILNSLIGIRNTVIHEDATPSITHQDVDKHLNNILRFVDFLEVDIQTNCMIYYHTNQV